MNKPYKSTVFSPPPPPTLVICKMFCNSRDARITKEQAKELLSLLGENRTFDAIKFLRNTCGCGLKAAHDIICQTAPYISSVADLRHVMPLIRKFAFAAN